MKQMMFVFLVLFANSIFAQEATPTWPQIGSAFPKGDTLAKRKVQRLGNDYWEASPKVIGPYTANWFEYNPIMWGGDSRITDKSSYFEFIKSLYINAGMVYSDDGATDINKAKLPFYDTNVNNVFYLENKGGDELRKKFKKSRSNEFLVRLTKKGSASLEDDKVNAENIAIAKGIGADLSKSKPLGYDLRDEGTYVVSSCSPYDFDFSPVSIKYFRGWLKGKYESIEKLNSKWNTTFKTWDEVMPLTTDEIFNRELSKAKSNGNITEFAGINLAPWADHREYNDDTFQSALARYSNAINEVDPGAPIGYSGTQMPSAYGGFDYWKIGNNISWIEYYDINGSREVIRSFMPHEYPKIPAVNLAGEIAGQFPRVWSGLLHGDSGILLWPYNGHDTKSTLVLDVDGQQIKASAKGTELAQHFKKLRNGVSTILRHSNFETNQVAIYYSQASIRADWILEVKRDGKSWLNRSSSWEITHNYYAAGRESFYKLLEDSGYQYSHISSEQVESNSFDKLGVKVIIMPRIIAMSNKEIENLKAFVKNGGVVISDLLAGRLDEHCVDYQDKLEINELLGINRGSFVYQEEKKDEDEKKSYVGGFGYPIAVSIEEDFGELKKGTQINVLGFYEPKVTANKAKAFGKTSFGPVILQNSFGNGSAFTLNFDLANYLQERNSNDANIQKNCELQRKIFKAILEKSKITPFSKITNANGNYPAGVETIYYTQDKSKFLALQVNDSNLIDWVTLNDIADKNKTLTDIKLKVDLPEAFYVTEMMSGKSFGKVKSIESTLTKELPQVFSLLTYQISEIGVTSTLVAENGLLPIEIKLVAKESVGDHVVNVELFDKDNKPVPQFLVNVPLSKGKYTGSFDFSHVKEKGEFELVLKDVLSGVSTKKKITIK